MIDIRPFIESPLVKGCGGLWKEATTAAFLTAIGDGTLPEQAFHRWLVQDYFFARAATAFQAIVVAKTPRPDNKPLIAGLAALDAELDWFESHISERRLDATVPMHPVCRRYVDFLIAAAYAQPFEVLLAIVYGAEVAYLASWGSLQATGPYAEFITRWTNEGFVVYVRSLLEPCQRRPHADAQDFFNETMRHEREFWRMTWEG